MVSLDSVLSLELAFLLYIKHVYQTSVCCLWRLQVVLLNDLPIFHQGQLSPKCTQIYVRPQKGDTYSIQFHIVILKLYEIEYSYYYAITNSELSSD